MAEAKKNERNEAGLSHCDVARSFARRAGHECQEHHFLNKSEMASRVPHGAGFAGTRPSVPERQTSRDGKELILRWCSREMNS